MNVLAKCEDAIALVEAGLAGNDEVAAALEFVTRLKQVARELDARLEAATIAWIDEHGPVRTGRDGPFWAVKSKKTVKCPDQRAALLALLEATGGDVDALSEVLSSGAFKHGAAKTKLSPEVYASVFTTVEEPEVRQVTRIDPAMLPGKKEAK